MTAKTFEQECAEGRFAFHPGRSFEQRRIERGIALGKEISALRERVKADTGITDEKVNPKDDEEEGISEAQG